MSENNFRKLFGNYPVLPRTFNLSAEDIKDTHSYPVIAGAIDDKNFYHQLKVHYSTNSLCWDSFYDANKIQQNLDGVVFEYIKTDYNNFFEIMNLQEKPYYINFSNSLSDIENSLYPVGFRCIDSQSDIVIFERPPFKMNIDFSPMKAMFNSKKRRKYEMQDVSIWIPWTVYLFDLSSKSQVNVYNYFNDKPLSSFSDIIFPSMLSNVFQEGRICFGDYSHPLNSFHTNMVKNKKYSLRSIFNEALSYFYSGGWNSDIIPHEPYPEFLRMYSSTRSMKAVIKDQNALSMYERALDNAVFYDINKLGEQRSYYYSSGPMGAYLNALSIWSQYSLEEVMYLFGSYYENARDHYANYRSYNENYNARPGISLEGIISGINTIKYHSHELKRHKLQSVFNMFSTGNNLHNVINATETPQDSSVWHTVNFGSGTALRKVYYENPMNNKISLKTKVFHQKELHDVLDHIIKEQQSKPEVNKVQQQLESHYA